MATGDAKTRVSYALLVFAGFVLGYSIVHPFYTEVDVILGLITVLMLVGAHFATGTMATRNLGITGIVLAAVLFARRAMTPEGFPYTGASKAMLLLLIVGLFATLPWIIRRPRPWILVWGFALMAAMTAMVWPELTQMPEPGIDVFHIHRSGAEALASGVNPYVHATAFNTSPLAEAGDQFEGYTYPPLALGLYATGQWGFGDPRFTSLIAILVFVGLVLALAAYERRPDVRMVLLGLVLVFAIHPGWQFVVDHAWTEPISLPLLLGVALLWRRRPTTAWVLLGLTLALKQYFILALPLLLFADDEERWRRLVISGSVAALTLLPGFLPDPVAYVNATIIPGLAAEPRPDAANLVQLGIVAPGIAGTAVAVLTGIVLARRGLSGPRFVSAFGAVLGISIFLGFGAFANHWFMVASLALVALVAYEVRARTPDEELAAARPTEGALP